ncbi:hypothetical protein A11S_1336 [Micavibrio aeruginosavorus EPB]|uniref:Uncharacterized protein n=1 Tax=Micavibrio aeruginosavorus EPB TaxID=349215 RepID=M4VI32_9BACT|nr:hypothetical protein A11S_1336 [Micavibrio aeruginosavorus EPB]
MVVFVRGTGYSKNGYGSNPLICLTYSSCLTGGVMCFMEY